MFKKDKKINNDKKKRVNFNIIFVFILVLSSLILSGLIIYANVLPIKYLVLALLIFAVLDSLTLYKILSEKTKNKTKKVFYLISILLSIIFLVASFFVAKTKILLNSSNIDYKTHNYSVIVLKDSKYDNLNDLENASVGYYDNAAEGLDESIKKIEDQIDVSMVPYTNLEELGYALLTGEIDSIIVDDSYKSILDNEEDNSDRLSDFKSLTKTVYTFSIKIKQEDISKDVDVTDKAFAVYISGIDTYGDISSVSCSDVNMVLVVNPKTHQILMVSIPRDYYVQLHGTTGNKDKLTHAGSYGIEMSIQTIEDLLDMDINYYLKVNFTSLIDIVDALGGVDVYSEYTFSSIEGYSYTAGYNRVNGIEALWFARERKAFIDGDRQRGRDQQALIDAIFRKATSKSVITKYNSLLNGIDGSFVTNMSVDRITALIKMQLSNNAKWTLTSTSLDGTDSSNYTYTYSNQLLYVMEPNIDSIESAKTMIAQVYNGEKLTASYEDSSSNVHTVENGDPIYYPEDNVTEEEPAVTKYTVTFDSSGGGTIASQSVEDGKVATEPADPTKEGYTFFGWYDETGKLYDFTNIVSKNTTLTAQWEIAVVEEEPVTTP